MDNSKYCCPVMGFLCHESHLNVSLSHMVILVGIEKVFGVWTSVGFCPRLDLGPVLRTKAQWGLLGARLVARPTGGPSLCGLELWIRVSCEKRVLLVCSPNSGK
jgi:hypothetical protein